MSSSQSLFDDHLDPQLDGEFVSLCESLSVEENAQLKVEVNIHVEKVQQSLNRNEFLDVQIAKDIAQVLNKLLELYPKFQESHQKLIVGAARYFVSEYDLEPDTSSILGFDDDVRVLNFVLKYRGLSELQVEI